MSEVERARRMYREWKALRDLRRSRGGQRPDPREVTALESLLEERENLSETNWDRLVAEFESDGSDLCDCGHHLALHHDRSGSCFQIVGCATACSCDAVTKAPR